MAAPQVAIAFLELLEKSQLLSSDEVAAAIRRHEFGRNDSPQRVAVALLEDGLLTRFQAAQLLKGRYKGFVIDGFKVLDILGSGGMGMVYIAQHIPSKRHVALKLLPESGRHDAGVRARFEMEARVGELLKHPNIVRTLKHGRAGDVDYMAMELVTGISLDELIMRQSPVSCALACGLMFQACVGLAHAHAEGIVHRDLKPANLLVDRSGGLKILDFGLAMMDGDEGEFALARIFGQDRLGTADFTAPEQTLDSYEVDRRADIYSLGCTLYATLTSKVPFPFKSNADKVDAHRTEIATPIRVLAPDTPKEIIALAERMMAKRPEQRPQTAEEVAAALKPFARRAPVEFDMAAIRRQRLETTRRRIALRRERKKRFNPSSSSVMTRGFGSGSTALEIESSSVKSREDLSAGIGRSNGHAPLIEIKHLETGATLHCVHAESLAGALLTNATLTGANLAQVDLAGASLSHASLCGADLSGARLADARMAHCVLDDANLEQAVLLRCDLTDASLRNCDFHGANLVKADLRRAIIDGTDFRGADLSGADLSMTEIKANLTGANLACANLRGSTFAGSNLTGAKLHSANLAGANFRGAIGPGGDPVFSAALPKELA